MIAVIVFFSIQYSGHDVYWYFHKEILSISV